MEQVSKSTTGAVVFLVDESTAMEARIAGGTKSKSQCIATALNALLNQLAGGPAVDVAIVGYRVAADGPPDIACRWAGPLAGRQFVSSDELAEAPLTIETRLRKTPTPGGVVREEPIRFPIWYRPTLGGPAVRDEAYGYCRRLLSAWLSASGSQLRPPLVISLIGELGPEERLSTAAKELEGLEGLSGPPWIVHAHLSTSARIPPTLYPCSDVHLPTAAARELFRASSPLPPPLVSALEQAQVTVNPNARGLIYNARLADLVSFLALAKAYAARSPEPLFSGREPVSQSSTLLREKVDVRAEAGAEAAPRPPAVLLVLLLDRSVSRPIEGATSVWARLQQDANELVAQIAGMPSRGIPSSFPAPLRQAGETDATAAKQAKGSVCVAVLSYGASASGEAAVDRVLPAASSGRLWLQAGDLLGAALRVDEVMEQEPNGIGGLVAVRRKRPIYVDQEAAGAASPRPAFTAVKDLLAAWGREHPQPAGTSVVLHLTRGEFPGEEIAEAVNLLGELDPAPRLYHLVRTESPHVSLAYPDDPSRLASPSLARLWELSSPLPGGQNLAARRPALGERSRGFVVNGKFDLLLAGVERYRGA